MSTSHGFTAPTCIEGTNPFSRSFPLSSHNYFSCGMFHTLLRISVGCILTTTPAAQNRDPGLSLLPTLLPHATMHTPADLCLPWLRIDSWAHVSILWALGYSAVGWKEQHAHPQAPFARGHHGGQPGLRYAGRLAHGATPSLPQIALPTPECA